MRHRHLLRWVSFTLAVSAGASLPAQTADRPFLVLKTAPQESLTAVAVSPDGAFVATGSFDGRLRIHDARTGSLLQAIGSDPSRGMRAVAYSPDGKSVAASGLEMDRTVKIWDPRTGALLKELAGHDTAGQLYADVNDLAFSPDGRRLASACRDGFAMVWDVASGKVTARLSGHGGPVVAVAFAPDGKTLATGGADRSVRLWDPQGGRPVRVLEGHSDWVCSLAFAPDGKTLASGSNDWAYHRGINPARFDRPDPGSHCEWKLWDIATGRCSRTVPETGRLSALAIAPDGRTLAAGAGGNVTLYDLRDETPGRVVATHDHDVTALAFAPDGKALYSVGHDKSLRRIEPSGGSVVWDRPGYWEQVNSVAIAPDGGLLATGSGDLRFAERSLRMGARGLGPGALRIWDARTGRLVRRLGDPAEQVMAVSFSPDGRRIAGGVVGPGGSVIRVWDASTGAPLWSRDDHSGQVIAVAFAPDGRALAVGDDAGRIVLRDPESGSVVRTLEGHGGGLSSIAFAGDGAIVAGGTEGEGARLWDARTGKLLRTVEPSGLRALAGLVGASRPTATSVALSRDGRTLATSALGRAATFGERMIRTWDVATGKLRREFSRPQSRGCFLAFSPDGNILAANGIGKSIALWDPRTGELLREVMGHAHPPLSAVFSPNGQALLSGGDYREAKVWEVASGRHLATLSTFNESRPGTTSDDWLAATDDGAYHGSPGIERFLAWRIGRDQHAPGDAGAPRRLPDRVATALEPIARKAAP